MWIGGEGLAKLFNITVPNAPRHITELKGHTDSITNIRKLDDTTFSSSVDSTIKVKEKKKWSNQTSRCGSKKIKE